ncbi:MAG: glutathione S-transferase family protein [Planctomycetota bacterium]|jgi:glutathione S-transferase
MSTEVVLHGFETSNNMKVRVALGYKGIPYRFRTIEPDNREEIVKISGQHLTPVLVRGDRVVFDSAAILRYLDTDFPATPRLFGRTHAEQWEIEDWELFARVELARPLMDVVHRRVYGKTVDDALLDRCAAAFADATTRLAHRLEDHEWLVGDTMSAADITAAAVMFRVRAAEIFPIPPLSEAVSTWIDKVMHFDGECRTQ